MPAPIASLRRMSSARLNVETRLLPTLAEAMVTAGLANFKEERRRLFDGDDVVVDSFQRGRSNGVNAISLGQTLFYNVDGRIAGMAIYVAAAFGTLLTDAKASNGGRAVA
jgi:hypothetical protein